MRNRQYWLVHLPGDEYYCASIGILELPGRAIYFMYDHYTEEQGRLAERYSSYWYGWGENGNFFKYNKMIRLL